jgi:hypothetical protein
MPAEEQLVALARCLGNHFACLVPVANPTAAGSQEDTDRLATRSSGPGASASGSIWSDLTQNLDIAHRAVAASVEARRVTPTDCP